MRDHTNFIVIVAVVLCLVSAQFAAAHDLWLVPPESAAVGKSMIVRSVQTCGSDVGDRTAARPFLAEEQRHA
jgi:hypothetical protein